MNLQQRMQGFVGRVEGVPVTWGGDDCSFWPALWVEQETGRTLPKASYSSADEAKAMIAQAGGLDVIWRQQMAAAGLHPGFGEPQNGDVGLVETRKFGLVGVIFWAPAMLWRAEAGVHYLSRRAVHSFWSVNCRD